MVAVGEANQRNIDGQRQAAKCGQRETFRVGQISRGNGTSHRQERAVIRVRPRSAKRVWVKSRAQTKR